MFPINMIYNDGIVKKKVLVYSFSTSYNSENNMLDIVVIAWDNESKTWVTDSLNQFTPVINKILKE